MDGFLNIDKPCGITSHDVVLRIRRLIGEGKVGHGGTLDPEATGVLPICIGKATKMAQGILDNDKEYKGEMVLGIATDTQDAAGNVMRVASIEGITEASINEILYMFRGEIEQIPPMFSAKRFRGKHLYELARAGRVVDRPARKVVIYSFDVDEFHFPGISFHVRCSKGTYIRTLCADIGSQLGCGAHLSRLRRVRCGPFAVRDSVSLEELVSQEDVMKRLLSLGES